MNQPWKMVLEIGYISLFMLIAIGIRRFIPFFRKFRIPDAIVAGALAVIAGPSVLGWIPFSADRLTSIVYHLMAIGFIALALKRGEANGRGRSAVSTSFYIVVSYGIQGFLGLAITLLFIKTLYPNLFPSFGFLLPFGFAQGPGLAGGMAAEWANKVSASGVPAFAGVDEATRLTSATSVGFSFSTIGFLWACLVGVPLMNVLVRRRVRQGESSAIQDQPPSRFMIEKEREHSGLARSIDKVTTQLILIGVIYVALHFFLKGVTWGLNQLTPLLPANLASIPQNMSSMFWGFHFGFGALIGTFVGKFIRWLEAKKFLKGKATNDYLLQHIGGTAIDFMIAASIAAINVRVLGPYILPILIITTAGGFTTMAYTWFFARKVWRKTYVEHFLGLFGMHTGTIATGMALLRGVDPQFRTSTATDMVYGSGIALLLGLPLIFFAGLPAAGFENGNPNLYWITLLLVLGYVAVIMAIWFNPWAFRFFTRHSRGVESTSNE